MNSVFLSPHFPPNFLNFSVQLRQAGAQVLGLADEPYESLHPELRENLTEYYRVSNMHDYDELVRALGYFTHRYGKLDHLDSHNEYWLETEAKLRTDFNIGGIKCDHIDAIKRKSEMKRVFLDAGLKPARGKVCHTEQELMALIEEVGYPVVAKPDIGVGAAQTFKLRNERDVRHYLEDKLDVDYIVEEFVSGQIITYDGLADPDGKSVFTSSLRYSQGVMDAVNDDSDIYYYAVRKIEPELDKDGQAVLRAFDVRARFFHFEFFLTAEGTFIPLEVNIRPPGGLTLNMFNYVFDFDCYRTWAEMVVTGQAPTVGPRLFYCIYIGRKNRISYSLSHSRVLDKYRGLIVHHERINSIFSAAIGNYGYLLRSPDLEPLIKAAEAIQKRESNDVF
jgi:hypothetical protein